jgi:hypothetical protein
MFSKKKYYDGTTKLKLIGQDCKQFEINIEKFVSCFLKDGESVADRSFEKIRNFCTLYRMSKDTAKDIRSIVNLARINSFQERVDDFFKTFKKYTRGNQSTGRKPYLHILREHISDIMKFRVAIGFGYGYFNCNGSEHWNKRVKTLELHSTNLDCDRFKTVMRRMRLKQFHFPESVEQEVSSTLKCSRCNHFGHNNKTQYQK